MHHLAPAVTGRFLGAPHRNIVQSGPVRAELLLRRLLWNLRVLPLAALRRTRLLPGGSAPVLRRLMRRRGRVLPLLSRRLIRVRTGVRGRDRRTAVLRRSSGWGRRRTGLRTRMLRTGLPDWGLFRCLPLWPGRVLRCGCRCALRCLPRRYGIRGGRRCDGVCAAAVRCRAIGLRPRCGRPGIGRRRLGVRAGRFLVRRGWEIGQPVRWLLRHRCLGGRGRIGKRRWRRPEIACRRRIRRGSTGGLVRRSGMGRNRMVRSQPAEFGRGLARSAHRQTGPLRYRSLESRRRGGCRFAGGGFDGGSVRPVRCLRWRRDIGGRRGELLLRRCRRQTHTVRCLLTIGTPVRPGSGPSVRGLR